jgi:ABC-2 type transport system ATP-binding protein
MEEAIIVDHLTKNFEVIEKEAGILGGLSSLISPKKKTVHALREISFSIKPGELVGFIGPNGAGKTTTLKVLSGLLYPTSGFTQVLGFDPWERNPKLLKEIALVMGQKNQLWWDLPAIDTLELNKAIYEIPDKKYKESFEELVNMLDVKKLLKTQVRRLSLGQRMRLELVAALIHRPKVLFLDEPTIGLDVVAQAKMRDFIHDYNRRHEATIILTSHNMDDVIDLAKRVIVVDKGKILFDGEIRKLVSQYVKEKIIKVYLSKESDVKELEKVGKIEDIEFPLAVLRVPRATAAAAAAEILHRLPVVDLNIEEEALEEIIRKIFSGEIKINKKK